MVGLYGWCTAVNEGSLEILHNGLVFNLNLFKKFANIKNLKVFVVGSNSTILNNTNYSGS